MNEPNPYFQEVVDAHVDIERWLSGRAEHGLLPALLERFSPHFSMVAARGAALDRAGLDALFRQGRGQRSGLRIEIDELKQIGAWRDGAVIGYRETQTDGEGRSNTRRSTVVFERDAARASSGGICTKRCSAHEVRASEGGPARRRRPRRRDPFAALRAIEPSGARRRASQRLASRRAAPRPPNGRAD